MADETPPQRSNQSVQAYKSGLCQHHNVYERAQEIAHRHWRHAGIIKPRKHARPAGNHGAQNAVEIPRRRAEHAAQNQQ